MLLEIGKFYETRASGVAKVTEFGGYQGKFSATLEDGQIVELLSNGRMFEKEVSDYDLIKEVG